MNRCVIGVVLAVGLAGCASTPRMSARYELDLASRVPVGVSALPLSEVTVRAPSWLEGPGMGYRLRYAEPGRREQYATSRWVAPPPELLAQAVRRALPNAPQAVGGCRLKIELDEFVQEFSAPDLSVGRLEARVRLVPPRGEAGAVFARQEITLPAPSADAAGGVEALSQASAQWVVQLREWIAGLAKSEATRGMCQVG